MATKDRILAELEKGGFSTKQLIAKLGGTYASIHTSLKRMKDRGLVVEVTEAVLRGHPTKLPEPTWFLVSKLTTYAAPTPAPTPPPLPSVGTYADAQKLAQAIPAKKLRTKAILVVDMSGSMNSFRYNIKESINKTINDLKTQAYRTGVEVDLSLYYFHNWRVEPQFRNVNIKDVSPVAVGWPDGGTPLFSAVEDAINDHLQPERIDEEVSYLLIAITDGEDNESRDRSGRTMKSLIARVQTTDRWTVTFEMPPGYKTKFCNTYGIHPGNCTEWEQTVQGFERATTLRTSAVSNYMTNQTKGIRSMSTFYTDLSDIDVTDLKKNLVNIQDRIKTFPVNAETEIKPFIEQKTGTTYEAGSAFYQLTKPEKIQDTKKLLIKEKTGRAVYAGAEARKLLGLPIGEDCRVKPGNHANFDLFVESTSVNRKLVRGTTVVHWPRALQ